MRPAGFRSTLCERPKLLSLIDLVPAHTSDFITSSAR